MVYLSFLFGTYLTLASLYMLVFALAAKWPKAKNTRNENIEKQHSIAVFIPAYKEDRVIIDVAHKALEQDYPNYQVIIIADSFQEETLAKLRLLPIRVIEVSFEKSTKAKALNQAMNQIKDLFDIALVLDADNVMEQGFLKKMNAEYSKGFEVVQARRVAKNLNSNFAILDAMSEAINNNIYNLGQVNIGFSARLVGSGMAFDYSLFKLLISKAEAVGGFDKELELNLLKEGKYIHYIHDALIYDEKVSASDVFGKQRTRWISAQFFYLRMHGWAACKDLLFKANVDYFNKAYQMALPPRILLPAILGIGSLVHCFVLPQLLGLWALGFVANVVANFISIPKSMFTKDAFFALCQLPKAIVVMVLAMFKLKGANKKFIHTPHG